MKITKYLLLLIPSLIVWCLMLLTEKYNNTINIQVYIQRNKNILQVVKQHNNYHDEVLQDAVYPTRNKILCVSFQGRLGNVLFQYASAFGIARNNNITLRVSIHDRISQVFQISAQKVSNQIYCRYAYKKFENKHCAYDPEMLKITHKQTMLHNYLQSWKYFQKYEQEIRKEFQFNKTIANYASMIFLNAVEKTKYFRKNATYVGVHIRRGDMFYAQITKTTDVWGYNVAPRSYIDKAMKYFKQHYKKVTFVFCSDDIRWTMWLYGRYQKLLNLVFIHQTPEIDLAILAMCNHTIITTGTFGWWSAWLAGGHTIYYKHYIKNDSVLRKQFSEDFSDYFLPSWMAME